VHEEVCFYGHFWPVSDPGLGTTALEKAASETMAEVWEDAGHKDRWVDDCGRDHPGSYASHATLRIGEGPDRRRLELTDFEGVLGYPVGATALAVASSKVKLGSTYRLRRNMVAKAVFVRFAHLSLKPVLEDMGLVRHGSDNAAFLAEESKHARLERGLVLATPEQAPGRAFAAGQSLVVMLLNGAGRRGMDLHAAGGTGARTRTELRTSIPVGLGEWMLAFKWPWLHDQHINVLELRAILGACRWRSKSSRVIGTLGLLLTDNMAAAGAMARGRGGSPPMQAAMRQIAAVHLAGRLRTAVGFVRSDHNPADEGSRELGCPQQP